MLLIILYETVNCCATALHRPLWIMIMEAVWSTIHNNVCKLTTGSRQWNRGWV